jgi:hypothetical protein
VISEWTVYCRHHAREKARLFDVVRRTGIRNKLFPQPCEPKFEKKMKPNAEDHVHSILFLVKQVVSE